MELRKVKKVIGIVGIIVFIAFILVVSLLVINKFGDIIKNPQEIRKITAGFGVWGYLFFIILNIIQIFFAPIPGHFLNISSGIIFGAFGGIIVSWIGVIAGGTIVMALARYFGKKILYYLLDKKARGFEEEITKRGLPFILFLSIFPNPIGDGLFYLAGITDVPFKVLIPLIFLGRLPGIIVSVLVGDRILNTGIKGWIIGGVGLLIAFTLYLIFGKKIEIFFERFIKRKFNKN